MSNTALFRQWTDRHRDVAFDLVRVYLGLGLFARGAVFIAQPEAFYGLIDGEGFAFAAIALGHYVALAHLVGGLLLAVGFLTRVAAIVQIPILFGAVFFVHLGEGLAAPGQGLEFAALVLVLLIAYAVYGSGRLSLDYYLTSTRAEADALEVARERERSPVLAEAAEAQAQWATPEEPAENVKQPCVHDRGRYHPRVQVRREYGLGSKIRFLSGTTGAPRRIVFVCKDCGGVVEVSERPEDIAYFTYNEEKRRLADGRGRAEPPELV